jgi:hypothetical protein
VFKMNTATISPSALTVVLFVSGNGADVNTYRPLADETQWYHRRDALVRCVASFLFSVPAIPLRFASTKKIVTDSGSPALAPSQQQKSNRELVLLFDGDGVRFHMKYEPRIQIDPANTEGFTYFVPTEKPIVSLWQRVTKLAAKAQAEQRLHARAAQLTSRVVAEVTTKHGLWCKLVYPPPAVVAPVASITGTLVNPAPLSAKALPPDCDKRQLFTEFIQPHCSIEFLRENQLNSSVSVVMRKFNRSQLRQLWYQWLSSSGSASSSEKGPNGSRTSMTTGMNRSPDKQLFDCSERTAAHSTKKAAVVNPSQEWTLDAVLAEIMNLNNEPSGKWKNASDDACRIVAGVLHESGDHELPVGVVNNGRSISEASCYVGEKLNKGQTSLQNNSKRLKRSFQVMSTSARSSSKQYPHSKIRQVFLFLGAVRDMTGNEYRSLERVCNSYGIDSVRLHCNRIIPILRIRIGPVPEFTSKILSVVAFHHNQHFAREAAVAECREAPTRATVLEQAIDNLLIQQSTFAEPLLNPLPANEKSVPSGLVAKSTQDPFTMHFIVLVPAPTECITTSIEDRGIIQWGIVRSTVVSLWRSRVASEKDKRRLRQFTGVEDAVSGDSNCGLSAVASSREFILDNIISFIFSDGKTVTLRSSELVCSMSAKHQAAPCEYQILSALKSKVAESATGNEVPGYFTWENHVDQVTYRLRQQKGQTSIAPSHLVHVVDDLPDLSQKATNLASLFYNSMSNSRANGQGRDQDAGSTGPVFVLLPVVPPQAISDSEMKSNLSIMRKSVVDSFRRTHERIRKQSKRNWDGGDLKTTTVRPVSLSIGCRSGDDWLVPTDLAGLAITVLQHFVYQNRFLSLLHEPSRKK